MHPWEVCWQCPRHCSWGSLSICLLSVTIPLERSHFMSTKQSYSSICNSSIFKVTSSIFLKQVQQKRSDFSFRFVNHSYLCNLKWEIEISKHKPTINEIHLFWYTVFLKHLFPSGNGKAGIQGTVLRQGYYNVLTIDSSTGSEYKDSKCWPQEPKRKQGLQQ